MGELSDVWEDGKLDQAATFGEVGFWLYPSLEGVRAGKNPVQEFFLSPILSLIVNSSNLS